jgi:nicotinamide-nucleotide amidase
VTSLTFGAPAHWPSSPDLARTVLESARRSAVTVAVAESLTGGRLAAALTAHAGASRVFRGSVTAYATELKAAVLGVDPELLAQVGAVDPEVARQMAEGVRRLCGADLGLSTTGVAGPDPQDGRPVGLVYTAIATASGAQSLEWHFSGDRARIQDDSVRAALIAADRRLSHWTLG